MTQLHPQIIANLNTMGRAIVEDTFNVNLGRVSDQALSAATETGIPLTAWARFEDQPEANVVYYDPLFTNLPALGYDAPLKVKLIENVWMVVSSQPQAMTEYWGGGTGSLTNVHSHENELEGGQLDASNIFNDGVVPLIYGGTGADLSSTGAATHFVRQASAGAAFTVGAITTSDLPTVPVTKGGTGKTSVTSGNLLLGAGASTLTELAPSTSGNVVQSNGTTFVSTSLNLSTAQLAGALPHERGGLEADVSAYDGLLKISGGATSQAVAGTDYTSPTGTENLSNKTITASSVNSTPIGQSVVAAGSFAALVATTATFSSTLTVNIGTSRQMLFNTNALSVLAGAAPADLNLVRANTNLSNPSQLGSAETIGRIVASGRDSSGYSLPSASPTIEFATTEPWAANHGSQVVVKTIPNGSTTPATAATFGQDKSLTVEGSLFSKGSTFGAFNIGPATRPTSTTEIKEALASMGLLTDGGASPLVTDNGYVDVGTAYLGISAGSNAGNNRFWQDTTQKLPAFQSASGFLRYLRGCFYSQYGTASINSNTLTSVLHATDFIGSKTMPADSLAVGSTLKFTVWGWIDQIAATSVLSIALFGGTTAATNITSELVSSAPGALVTLNRPFKWEIIMTVVTSTTVQFQNALTWANGSAVTPWTTTTSYTGLSSSTLFDIKMRFSTYTAGDVLTVTNVTMEQVS